MTTDVAVLLGSKSDRDISEKTIEIFDRSGVKVFIAIAGLAARIIDTGDKEPGDKLAAHRMELAEQSLQDSQTLF